MEREYVQNNMEFINPPEAGKHPGFSHGVKVACGSLLFVAGQVGWDENGMVVSTEFVGQLAKALSNVLSMVRQEGGQPFNIVRVTIYVLDRREYTANLKPMGEAYRSQMGKHYPAMTLVEVKGLLEEGCKLKLEATAVL